MSRPEHPLNKIAREFAASLTAASITVEEYGRS